MSVAVNLSRAWQLSSHIHNMCSEAREAIYTREADVKHWLDKGQWGPSSCVCLTPWSLEGPVFRTVMKTTPVIF